MVGSTWLTREHVVTIAALWHFHSAPKAGFSTGVGNAKPIETATVAQANTAPMSRRILRFQNGPLIAVTPR
jgi:hypothetical protein